MSNDINLIANRKKSSAQKEKVYRAVNIAAFVSLGIVVICAVGVFLLNQDPSYVQLAKKEKVTLSELSLSNTKIAKFLIIKNRLQDINKVINSRSTYEQTISQLAAGVTSGISVEAFSLTKQEVALNVSSASLSSINTFLSFMVDLLNSKKLFKSITLNSVSADPVNSKYVVVLEAKFK